MDWRTIQAVAAGAALLATSAGANAVTLDREGTLEVDLAFRCDGYLDFEQAGGHPHFSIETNGRCAVVDQLSYLPGWGGADWQAVRYEGRYDYETGEATEEIELPNGQNLVVAKMTCTGGNPWVTGKACKTTSVKNHVPAEEFGTAEPKLQLAFPVSALRLEHGTRQALASWEAEQGQPDPLADWNPIAPSNPSMSIVSPGASVPGNAPSFELDVDTGSLTPVNAVVEIEWMHIVPAKDPSIAPGGDWKNGPAAAPASAPLATFPFAVDVATSGFELGHYAVRVKYTSGDDSTWSDYRHFWIGGNAQAGLWSGGVEGSAFAPIAGAQGRDGAARVEATPRAALQAPVAASPKAVLEKAPKAPARAKRRAIANGAQAQMPTPTAAPEIASDAVQVLDRSPLVPR